ncbi:MAG TPA: ABC transporter ATP-binding protein [Steroidobacteraceae bacterium]|nr:ABC transporter ATP-binding protein [Steroidobacteraceae bacterium]
MTSDERPPSAERTGGAVYLYQELWRTIRGERRKFLVSVALLTSAQLALLAIPYASARAIDALQIGGTGALTGAGKWLALSLAIAAGAWLLHGPGRLLERAIAITVRQRMSAFLIERLTQQPLSWHEAHHSGATAHRVQQSTIALMQFAQSQFVYLNSAVRLFGPLAALWLIAPQVGGAAIVGFAVIVASVVGFDRAMLRLACEENAAERSYAAALVDTLGNVTTLYALRQARAVARVLEKRLLAVFEPLKRSIWLNEVKWCTVDIATKVLSAVLVALFAWLAEHRAPAAGAHRALLLGSVYMVWEYAQQSAGVISAIASHFQSFARLAADYGSADAIRQVRSEEVSAPLATGVALPLAMPDSHWNRIELREMTFRYVGRRATDGVMPTLDHLALSLRRGRRYALIGRSGSGKSTLLRALAGLNTCERITLRIDEGPTVVSPAEVARILRSAATLIPQDAEVFAGSVADNLSLCESVSGPPSTEEFLSALEIARATDFIEATPAGLQARIAERAANWSGGQRSRVALARGVLAARGSALVLLDEPTANLDRETEARVYSNLFEAFADSCIVSSVHRLDLLPRFDEVIAMEEGRIIAHGSPAIVGTGFAAGLPREAGTASSFAHSSGRA